MAQAVSRDFRDLMHARNRRRAMFAIASPATIGVNFYSGAFLSSGGRWQVTNGRRLFLKKVFHAPNNLLGLARNLLG